MWLQWYHSGVVRAYTETIFMVLHAETVHDAVRQFVASGECPCGFNGIILASCGHIRKLYSWCCMPRRCTMLSGSLLLLVSAHVASMVSFWRRAGIYGNYIH